MFTSDCGEEDSKGFHEGGITGKSAFSVGRVEVLVGSVHAPACVTISMPLLPFQKNMLEDFTTIGQEEYEADSL